MPLNPPGRQRLVGDPFHDAIFCPLNRQQAGPKLIQRLMMGCVYRKSTAIKLCKETPRLRSYCVQPISAPDTTMAFHMLKECASQSNIKDLHTSADPQNRLSFCQKATA